jgi:two-component system sensor histidine kinase KdpD
MSREHQRPDPDVLLARLKAEEEPQRGRLRVWLGAASGVGKTYAMLQEGLRRKARGTDVVVGFVEPHGRRDIENLIGDLEVVPPLVLRDGDSVAREMDTQAVIARHPKVALVDELAHTNAPGSKHEKRYQDVEELLDAGITVISTLNVQNIESLADFVRQMTGIEIMETVPDSVLDRADQLELVDLMPDVLIQRVRECKVCPPDEVPEALATFYTPANLMAMRDLALRATAREVEERLSSNVREGKLASLATLGDRVTVAVDHGPVGRTLIRRGWRMAAALKGELIVVHVDPSQDHRKPGGAAEERQLEDNLRFAEDLGATVVRLHGNVAEQLLAYVRENQIAHLFIGHPRHGRWEELLRGSVTGQILRKLPDINVHVIGNPTETVPGSLDGQSGAAPHLADENAARAEPPAPDRTQVALEPVPGEKRGMLRIFLGAAPGVGKTYTMLQEGHRLKSHGEDVVVGFIETHGRPHTAEQIGDLEVVPPLEIPYKGVTLREMDTDAVIARNPKIALVDELAHTNAPGSKHEKRYQDVFELMSHGIDVITTLNIQHAESLNDIVEGLTGVRVRETVPDWVFDEAEQIELIDMAPEALIRRMVHGNVYPPEQARRALENFFTVANLSVLRDLALRATAREVEDRLTGFMESIPLTAQAGSGEKVMVAVDHRPIGKRLIRTGWRLAAALKAELIVVHVEPDTGRRQAGTVEDERTLRASLQLADELGATVIRLRGKVSDELIAYARAQKINALVIGHPSHSRLEELLHGSVTNDILREIPQIDLHVVASSGR